MNEITKISFTYVVTTIGLLALILLLYLFIRFNFEPPIFIPPAEEEVYLFEKEIQKATNLEGLKRSCTRFARCQDEANAWREYYRNQIDRITGGIGISILFVIIFYGWGFWKVYRISKQSDKNEHDAL